MLNQLSKEVARILNLRDIKDRMLNMSFAPATSTPEEHHKSLREQIERLSKLVREIGLRAH